MGRMPILAPILAVAAVCALVTSERNVQAQSIEEFYRGKQARVIISAAPATDYDMFARLTTAQMTKLLPGNPGFLAQNMPGAGGIVATNYLYNVAPQDGSVLGM